MSAIGYETRLNGSVADAESELAKLNKRVQQAREARKTYEPTWMESQAFAAGKQWVAWNPRTSRIFVPKLEQGRSRQTADILNQNLQTALGELTSDDLRPQFLFASSDRSSEDMAAYANKGLAWGWEYEWDGDARIYQLVNKLAVHGTGAIRCRYDRSKGPVRVSVPHPVADFHYQDPESGQQHSFGAGQPITHPPAAAHYVAQQQQMGLSANIAPIREGKVVWEVLSVWNLLPPPGVEDESDFPWEIIVRPIYIPSLEAQYGPAAGQLKAEAIEQMDVLGREAPTDGQESAPQGKLENHVLVYTSYERPCPEYPEGRTVVFTETRILDSVDGLPYPDTGGRPASTGITYFKWWPVAGRFFGKGFIEPGVGPQRTRNKRITQIDEIIDRGLPYVLQFGRKRIQKKGVVMEVVVVPDEAGRPPAPQPGIQPGQWMIEDVQMHDVNVEKALGVHPGGVGENPSGVNAYAQLALVVEQNMKKFGPVNARLKLGVGNVSCDSLEAMRQWPRGKRLLVGGPEQVEALEYDASRIPTAYVLKKPGKAATLPHSIAAEMQKIGDVWQARQTMGPPSMEWLQWYVDSLNAGKMLELPLDSGEPQRRAAALENLSMLHGAPSPPVHEWDEFSIHDPIHAAEEERLGEMTSPELQGALEQIQAHRQAHLALQQQNMAQIAMSQQQQVGPQPLGATGTPPPPQIAPLAPQPAAGASGQQRG